MPIDTEDRLGARMEQAKAKELLDAERRRVEKSLSDLEEAGQDDRTAANEPGDMSDSAEPLTREEGDDSVAAELNERLAAIGRAEERLAAGTYGYSVRSGDSIPDDRLEADPAAELTIEEARQAP
jgi:DnaK suppressor protein